MWTNHQIIASHEDVLSVNLLGVCRLCMLEGCTSMESIFQSSLPSSIAEKITIVTRLSLAEGDGLPTMVCQQCLFQLDVADTFIQRCALSDRSFRCLSTDGEREAATSCNETPAPTSSVLGASDAGGQYNTSAAVQDPADQITQSIEYPIKLEVTDDLLSYEEQAPGEFTAEDYESEGYRFGENNAGDNISIKIEMLDRVEIANIWTEDRCDRVVSDFETDVESQSSVAKILPVVDEKHKCSMCTLEFATRRSLIGHSIFHKRQQKKLKLAAASRFKKMRREKQAEVSNETFVAPGELYEKENVNILTNSEVQDGGVSRMTISNDAQNRGIPPPLQSDVVSQSLEKRIKCAICPSDFPSHKSLAAHNKFHKRKGKNKSIFQRTTSLKQPVRRVSVASQHAQSDTCINIKATEFASSKDDYLADESSNPFTADEFESSHRPKIKRVLSVNGWYKCLICSCKFSTKLKRTLHICHGKDAWEKIFQHRLRNRASKKLSGISPKPLTLTGQGDDGSSSLKFCGVFGNASDVLQEEPKVLSAPPLSAGNCEILSTDLQEHNSGKSSYATTNLREAAELEVQPIVKAKQLKRFKCDVCSKEFFFSSRLKRHMQVVKGHDKINFKLYHPIKALENKSTRVPRLREFKEPIVENLPLDEKACDVSVVAKLDDLSTNNSSLLEEKSKDVPDGIFTIQPPISRNQVASVLSASGTNDETVTKDEISPSAVNLKCGSCMSQIWPPLSLAQHICHTKDHNSEKFIDGRLCVAQNRTTAGKQLQPAKTHVEVTSRNFQTKARRCNVLATCNKQQVITAQEHREDMPDLPDDISLSIKLLSAPTLAPTGKESPMHPINHEPKELDNQSKAAQKELSQMHTNKRQKSHEEILPEKGSKFRRDLPVLKKGQKVKPKSDLLEDNKVLPSEERFLGRQDLSKLQYFNEGHHNILNRQLIVQLNRLTVFTDLEKEVATDFTQHTQSKISGPTTKNISVNDNLNGKSQISLQGIEKTMPCMSSLKNGMAINKEASYAESGDMRKKPKKFTCKFCSLDFIDHLALARHVKKHKKQKNELAILSNGNDDDLPCSQYIASNKNSDAPVSMVKKDVDSNSQQCKASPDSTPDVKKHKKQKNKLAILTNGNDGDLPCSQYIASNKNSDAPVSMVKKNFVSNSQQCKAPPDSTPDDKPMQLCRMELSCHVCSAQFSTEFDLATHAKLHKKCQSLATPLKSQYNPLADAVEVSNISCKTQRVPCDGCLKTFASSGTQRKHKRIFSCGSKMYKCDFCPEAFYKKSNSTEHIKSKHLMLPIAFTGGLYW